MKIDSVPWVLLVLLVLSGSGLAIPSGDSRLLSPEELASAAGTGCEGATGFMLAMGYASGFTFALAPPASAIFLGAAAAFGLYVVMFC